MVWFSSMTSNLSFVGPLKILLKDCSPQEVCCVFKPPFVPRKDLTDSESPGPPHNKTHNDHDDHLSKGYSSPSMFSSLPLHDRSNSMEVVDNAVGVPPWRVGMSTISVTSTVVVDVDLCMLIRQSGSLDVEVVDIEVKVDEESYSHEDCLPPSLLSLLDISCLTAGCLHHSLDVWMPYIYILLLTRP